MADFYDERIKKIQLQKKEYLELDEFMHSDEIKKIVEKLPDEDSVIITQHCCKDNMPRLNYESQNNSIIKEVVRCLKSPKGTNISEFSPFNNNHELDKKGIKIWLYRLLHIINE